MDMTCTDVDLFLKKLTFTLLCKREREIGLQSGGKMKREREMPSDLGLCKSFVEFSD